ncbi:hypothetical protein JDV02_009030 [Purpureocillium takamizusanense]|uniref:Uncharacterized protein n=1 Tax=Purpureocillium takamizusanense TaxID=2060973 RepID=A0A9Q8VFA2_9HYPO|nr:uncharacterized protein JDV02_009030 [Purpureocillium takamizusanense]UNI23196.1 hypothetical protein JDV02_009030 [Purpureocillium takamizusanense]
MKRRMLWPRMVPFASRRTAFPPSRVHDPVPRIRSGGHGTRWTRDLILVTPALLPAPFERQRQRQRPRLSTRFRRSIGAKDSPSDRSMRISGLAGKKTRLMDDRWQRTKSELNPRIVALLAVRSSPMERRGGPATPQRRPSNPDDDGPERQAPTQNVRERRWAILVFVVVPS